MKKINYVKIILDITMVIVFTLLYNTRVLGMTFHEVAGLAIGAIILVHCGLNWKWIKGVTLKFFNKGTPFKTRLGYIVDLLLLINVIVIIVTGIFISKTLFSGLNFGGAHSYKFLHVASSYFSLILIGIHLGLHWNWVMIMFKRIVKLPEQKMFSYLSKALAVVVLVFGIYTMNSSAFLSRISPVGANGVEGKMRIEGRPSGESRPNVEGREATEGNSAKAKGDQTDKGSFQKPGEGNFSGKPQNIKGGKGGSTSIISVITTQLGIISVFTIGTFYIEQVLSKRKKRNVEAISS
jgi:hypothetical protein